MIATFAEAIARTRILQHRVHALWKIRGNAVVNSRGGMGSRNLLNAALATGVKPGQVEPWLNRLQFDLIYTF